MRNIWNESTKKKISVRLSLSIVVYIVIFVVVLSGISTTVKASKEQEVLEVTSAINSAITLCYATEGSYPQNLDYLKVNYDLNIDENKYIVHYDIFASNIPPEVQVFKIRD